MYRILILMVFFLMLNCKKEDKCNLLFLENQEEAIEVDFNLSTTNLREQIEKKLNVDLCRAPKFYGYINNKGKKMVFPALFVKKCEFPIIYDGISIEFFKEKILIDSKIIVNENFKEKILNFNRENNLKKDMMYVLLVSNDYDRELLKNEVIELLESFYIYSNEISIQNFKKEYIDLNDVEKNFIKEKFSPRICLLE